MAMTTTSLSDTWMISVDDHLIEPPTVWVDRLPAKYRDLGPRWVHDDLGEAWLIEGAVRVPVNGAVVAAAFPQGRKPPSFQPLAWSEIPASCYDPIARAEAMDLDHVLASLPFPNVPGFAGRVFQDMRDKDLALLCIQAYNDWVIDEFAVAIPGRIIAVALVPMWDGRLAAAEAERALAKGACSISFSMAPHKVGFPAINDEHWDPLFAVMSNADLPICTHLGTGFESDPGLMVERVDEDGEEGATGGGPPDLARFIGLTPNPARPREHPAISAVVQLSGQETLIDWLTSGNFERYPRLKLALSENGIGWIPSVLQMADEMTKLTRSGMTSILDAENDAMLTEEARREAQRAIDARAEKAARLQLPTDMFREHIYGCFIDDPLGLRLIDLIGVDNVMIETDFPHITSCGPGSLDKVRDSIEALDADVREKVLRTNAERVFKFTAAEPPAMAGGSTGPGSATPE
jgi:predicted TIM-barrel fold metal-dependent hydrolase